MNNHKILVYAGNNKTDIENNKKYLKFHFSNILIIEYGSKNKNGILNKNESSFNKPKENGLNAKNKLQINFHFFHKENNEKNEYQEKNNNIK